MTDKQKIIELQRELKKIKEAADMALFKYCVTPALSDYIVAKRQGKEEAHLNGLLSYLTNSFYSVWDIPVDVQEFMEDYYNCRLCIPESYNCFPRAFMDLPLKNGKHPLILETHNIESEIEVRNGQANIIEIFKITGEHTALDPDHKFIENVTMQSKTTITIRYGS